MLEAAPQASHAVPAFFGTLTIGLVVVGYESARTRERRVRQVSGLTSQRRSAGRQGLLLSQSSSREPCGI